MDWTSDPKAGAEPFQRRRLKSVNRLNCQRWFLKDRRCTHKASTPLVVKR